MNEEIVLEMEKTSVEKEGISFLEELIGTKAKIRTLEFLLSHPLYDYTIKDICENTGLQRLSVAEALKNFVKHNIVVQTRRIGRAMFYTINMENPITKAFLDLHLQLARIMVEMENTQDEG